jgi:DNA-binding response OmpR family regulator
MVSPHAIAAAIYTPTAKQPDDALGVIKVTICRLRKHLAGTPLGIETVYSRGYLLRVIVARPVAPRRAAEAPSAASDLT